MYHTVMHHTGNAFFISYVLYVLLGVVLVARVLAVSVKLQKTYNPVTQKREIQQAIQKQFQIVGVVLVVGFLVLQGIYHFTQH